MTGERGWGTRRPPSQRPSSCPSAEGPLQLWKRQVVLHAAGSVDPGGQGSGDAGEGEPGG